MCKGRTVHPSEGEGWTYRRLELEVTLPENSTEETFQEALVRAEALIDQWLTQPETPHVPQLDPSAIEALPWKDREGLLAKPGAWGWLHGPESYLGPEQGAADLIKALDARGGRLTLGNYEYSYAKDKAFIQRRPVKGG
ncbi:MAG: hypothetical protein ACUVQY_11350 [Thermoproteota archaeon]